MVHALVVGPPANDAFGAATAVQTLPAQYTADTRHATTEAGEPAPSCLPPAGTPTGNTVWYAFTALGPGTLRVATFESSFDTVVAVYRGDTLGTLAEVACNDDAGSGFQSEVTWDAVAGTTYVVQVGGYNAAAGDLLVNVGGTAPIGGTPTPTPSPTPTASPTPTSTPTATATATATASPTPTATPTCWTAAPVPAGAGSRPWSSTCYGYDALERLAQVDHTDGTYATYGYDPVGNRQRVTRGSTTSYGYDAADRLTSAGGRPYTPDANGNLRTRGSGGTADSFGYDAANRLTAASVLGASGLTTATYSYDGDGQRTRATTDGTSLRSVYDIAGGLPVLLAEYEGSTSGVPTRKYVWGAAGLAYAEDATGALSVYHTDGLGSVRVLTNGASPVQVVQTAQTDEFGVPRAAGTQGTSAQPFGFTGERQDPTGLLDLRARMYDPQVGRFLQRDSFGGFAGDPQSLNGYSYTQNNPGTYTDPSGHFLDTALDVAFIGYDVYALASEGAGDSWVNVAALGADVAGAAIPFATGLGLAVRGAKAGAHVAAAARGARAAEHLGSAAVHANQAAAREAGVVAHEQRAETAAEARSARRRAPEFVEFAHGTTRESAEEIMSTGLNREANLKHLVGSREPGSFFTVRVDPADPAAAIETAHFWGSRHEGETCVLVCRLPTSVVTQLKRRKALAETTGPTQSVFRPSAYETVNRHAQWHLADLGS